GQRHQDEKHLLYLHRHQIEAEQPAQRHQQKWENGWVGSRTVNRNGGIENVTGIGIRAAFDEVLRVVDVHGEVVAPEMTIPQGGQVEYGDRCEKANQIEICTPGGEV